MGRQCVVFLALSFVLSGCTLFPPPDPGHPELCESSCAHLTELKCPEAEDLPPPMWNPEGETATCLSTCLNVENSETVTLNPACIMAITDCSQVQDCTLSQAVDMREED